MFVSTSEFTDSCESGKEWNYETSKKKEKEICWLKFHLLFQTYLENISLRVGPAAFSINE